MTRTILAILTVLAIAPAQLFAADREHEQLMADIRMLQEQTLRLHQFIAGFEGTLETLSSRLDDQDEAVRRSFADQRLTAENVASGVRVLREKLDETNVRLSSMSQEVEALRISIPPAAPSVAQLLVDPETGLPTAAATPAVGTVPPPTPTAAASAGVSPQRMYNTAWADYTSGQWALAVQGFEAYVKTFPRSELTDDAAYYVGQTYFAEGNFEEAVVAFEEVLLTYPDGDIVPEASYKRGLALDRLGQPDRARQAFELVVANYPDSTMATLAQQALGRLSQP